MDKPQPHARGPFYEYGEVMQYLEFKYGIYPDNYTPKNGFTEEQLSGLADWQEKPYLNFWHWVCDMNEIHNGGTLYLDLDAVQDDEHWPGWVCEILGYIKEEFQPEGGDMRMWVSW